VSKWEDRREEIEELYTRRYWTLDQIGKHYRVTKQRIQQVMIELGLLRRTSRGGLPPRPAVEPDLSHPRFRKELSPWDIPPWRQK